MCTCRLSQPSIHQDYFCSKEILLYVQPTTNQQGNSLHKQELKQSQCCQMLQVQNWIKVRIITIRYITTSVKQTFGHLVHLLSPPPQKKKVTRIAPYSVRSRHHIVTTLCTERWSNNTKHGCRWIAAKKMIKLK